MSSKKIFLDDTAPIKQEKKNNYQKINDKRQPVLQIFFKNNKKEKNIDKNSFFYSTPKSSKFNSSFNNLSQKETQKNIKERNGASIRKIKNNRYILSNNKFKKDGDLYRYIKSEKTNEKQINLVVVEI